MTVCFVVPMIVLAIKTKWSQKAATSATSSSSSSSSPCAAAAMGCSDDDDDKGGGKSLSGRAKGGRSATLRETVEEVRGIDEAGPLAAGTSGMSRTAVAAHEEEGEEGVPKDTVTLAAARALLARPLVPYVTPSLPAGPSITPTVPDLVAHPRPVYKSANKRVRVTVKVGYMGQMSAYFPDLTIWVRALCDNHTHAPA